MNSSNETDGGGEIPGEIVVCPDLDATGRAVASAFVRWSAHAIGESGRFAVALSGGSTPRPLYRALAHPPFKDEIRWSRVALFWGDERCVPPDHPDSNYRMVYEALLSQVPIPSENVYRMKGEIDPPSAADEYEGRLRDFFGVAQGGWPSFDLALLGVGSDGHTASLFPESPVLQERKRWVAATYVEKLKASRLTLTLPVFNHARRAVFLIAGEEKGEIAKRLLTTAPGPAALPAQRIRPRHGERLVFLDQAAARWIGEKRG